jgi:hypothetical protein
LDNLRVEEVISLLIYKSRWVVYYKRDKGIQPITKYRKKGLMLSYKSIIGKIKWSGKVRLSLNRGFLDVRPNHIVAS